MCQRKRNSGAGSVSVRRDDLGFDDEVTLASNILSFSPPFVFFVPFVVNPFLSSHGMSEEPTTKGTKNTKSEAYSEIRHIT